MEEHSSVITGEHAINRKATKCGYLFIAPKDWDFSSSVQKTKRWQRRWFVLYDDGELTWSLDEQPDTIPQGTLDMNSVIEVSNAESVTDNQYSLRLSTSKGTTVFIKGVSNEEIRSWELKFKKCTSGVVPIISSSKRRMTIGGSVPPQLSSCVNKKCSSSSSSSGSSSSVKSSRFLSDVSLMSPRGDPDGCGEKSIDHGPLRKGWLLKFKQEDSCWCKYWFVLRNSKLLYFTNADEEECLGSISLDVNSKIEPVESTRHYGFNVNTWSLAAITNGMRGIWIKSLESAKATPPAEVITEQAPQNRPEPVTAASTTTPTSSPTSSVVLSPLLKSKKNLKWRKKAVIELKEQLDKFNSVNNSMTSSMLMVQDTSSVDEIVELKTTIRKLENEIESLEQERMILSLRLNDFTEKLYQSEKTNKQLRLKMNRVKGQSLKDKQIEIELLNKISLLEDEIKNYTFNPNENVSCAKCQHLEAQIKDREIKLNELENCIGDMEIQFNQKIQELRDFITTPTELNGSQNDVRLKYQMEIGELKNLCSKGLEALENSHRRMITELEEKHRREIQSLRIEKEAALQEETNATLAALDALRKNHEIELQREMTRFKDEFIRKFQDGQDLSALHREHEEELTEIKNEILLLSDNYSNKCLEASKMEETIEHLNNLLLDAKRRILSLEGAGFLGVLCYSLDNNNDKDIEPSSKSSECSSQTRKSILRSSSFQKLSK
ncbi:unnamed protein product [Allacma fusca]|uniref:PH domain-containing protein n=1 Tax=Allacma fusca TaxID=39272 RepID=A0A8J2KHB8_9HEXA|nr:unnamed protein product [Allacma fusca]